MNSKIALIAISIGLLAGGSQYAIAQPQTLDSLRTVVQETVLDSTASPIEQRRVLSAYLYQSKSNNSKEDIIYAYQQLAALNYNAGDINQALKYYKLYVLELEELTEFEEFKDQQFEKNLFENEIRALNEQIKELESKNEKLEEEKKVNYEQNYIIYIGLRIALGLAIILVFGWFYQLYRKSKTAKIEVPEPVSNNQELTDILHQTKAQLVNTETELALADILVQRSISSPEDNFNANKSLRRKFLVLQPKDLTSGAGLYLHTVKNTTLIVFFDTTSTGAPGGLLAAQIYQKLDEIVKNLGITSPSLVLEQLEKSIMNLFPAGVPFTSGISCAICLYNSSDRTITFNGANLDLYQVAQGQLHIHHGTNKPILSEDGHHQANNVIINVDKGSNYYLCTEAYWCQQGGHEFKALGIESFEKTIVSMHRQNTEEQKKILTTVFDEWRGGNEQYGDALVFGFML